MVAILEQHLESIRALCVQSGVRRLDLFGSAAMPTFDPLKSDYDFFVDFHDLGWKGSFRRYMNLKLGLEDLLGREVDLIETKAVDNPFFLEVANRHREEVYAA